MGSEVKRDKYEILAALELADSMNLSDGAYWCYVHETLGMDYGDIFPILNADLDFYNCRGRQVPKNEEA